MPFWERKQTIKILWQISPPPRILTLTTYTHTLAKLTTLLFIIALVWVCRAFTQNDGFPCLLHLFASFGRSNLQKALLIFAIIGTEMPHRSHSAGLLSASQLSGQFVKPRHYFFSRKSITRFGVWGVGGVRKVMKIKLFSPCHTEECSRPSLEMSMSIMEQQKNRRKKDFCRHSRKINTHTRRKVVGTYWK